MRGCCPGRRWRCADSFRTFCTRLTWCTGRLADQFRFEALTEKLYVPTRNEASLAQPKQNPRYEIPSVISRESLQRRDETPADDLER